MEPRTGRRRLPDEAAIRDAIGARLGYDPFRDDAPLAISATIRRAGGALRARVESRDASGAPLGQRTLTSSATDCDELATTLALAISIAIDPVGLAHAAVPSAPTPPPPPAPLAPPAPPALPPPPAPRPAPRPPRATVAPTPRPRGEALVVRASVGGSASYGLVPGWTFAPTAQFGFRFGHFALGVEGRVDLPQAASRAGVGTVSAVVYLASLVPCAQTAAGPVTLMACAIGGVGAMEATASGVTTAMPRSSFFAVAGIRAGVEVPLYARRLWLRATVDGLAVVTPTSLEIQGSATDGMVWISPPVAFVGGIALAYDFL